MYWYLGVTKNNRLTVDAAAAALQGKAGLHDLNKCLSFCFFARKCRKCSSVGHVVSEEKTAHSEGRVESVARDRGW